MSSAGWLQHGDRAQCNGDRQHAYGFTAQSPDDPGRLVHMDPASTQLAARPFAEMEIISPGSHDWRYRGVEAGRFIGAGGPLSLKANGRTFRDGAGE